MPLLIDGYNLLHATGIFGKGTGPGWFERSRKALLEFLAASLRQRERRATTIVFDASEAPPGLPSQTSYEGITVYFSRQHSEADDLIEELIESSKNPRRLMVISSDHRLQRAARRRGATAIDSNLWYHDLRQEVAEQAAAGRHSAEKPEPDLSPAQVDAWLKEFGVERSEKRPVSPSTKDATKDDVDLQPSPAPEKPAPETSATAPRPKSAAAKKKPADSRRRRRTAQPAKKPPHLPGRDISNPFPPGYGSDVSGE